jgi:hypothetical protein
MAIWREEREKGIVINNTTSLYFPPFVLAEIQQAALPAWSQAAEVVLALEQAAAYRAEREQRSQVLSLVAARARADAMCESGVSNIASSSSSLRVSPLGIPDATGQLRENERRRRKPSSSSSGIFSKSK